MMKSVFLGVILLLVPFFPLFTAEPLFEIHDLSADDKLLFTCSVEQPGWDGFTTAFRADLQNDDRLEILTMFPERSTYFSNTGELEILNRFGLFRASLDGDRRFRRLSVYSSFIAGDRIPEGRVLPTLSSPDGRWILVQEATGPVRCNLVIYDNQSGDRHLLSRDNVQEFSEAPGLWSPDSRYLLYSRDDKVYFVTSRQLSDASVPDESYRIFGDGNLRSVRWAGPDALYYTRDSLVTVLRPSEFFTRSFYAEPLPAGRSLGEIPVSFDPQFDRFWPAPDGESVLLLKNGQSLFQFPLDFRDRDDDGQALSLPVLRLPKNQTVLQLWWRSSGTLYLLTGESRRNPGNSALYTMDTSVDHGTFIARDVPEIRRFVPSPDGTKLGILENDGISVRSVDTLSETTFFNHPDPRNLFWRSNDEFIVVGGQTTKMVKLESGFSDFLSLSSVDRLGYDRQGEVVAEKNGSFYRWDSVRSLWEAGIHPIDEAIRRPVTESNQHRVYAESLSSAVYQNQVYVRRVDGYGTRALFDAPIFSRTIRPSLGDDALPSAFDDRIFDHGSRKRREIALVFNAVDSDEGLDDVLEVLSEYGIRSTFFVGGDFLRRNPESTRYLASFDHEIGSLFYTHMDMTDYRYRIDTEFVVRGLARNEDEFFRTTGSEVSTIWHAPWYVVTPPVLDASQRMNYVYVGRDLDPLDWVSLDAPPGTRDLYRSSVELVEEVLEDVRPGSIVPIRIGKPGERKDYFFRELELLINGLLRDGYDIVSVGELKENFR